jgi:LmbE family N-acetylglucosaminyl deacetylase
VNPTIAFLTSGRSGQQNIRIAEARAACREFAATPVFLGYPVERIPIHGEVTSRLAELFDSTNAEALFVPFFGDDNDDHRRANQLLRDAARSLPLKSKPEIWAYQVYSVIPGNVMVDITEQKGAKERAIAHYKSEMDRRDWINFSLGLNAFNSRLLPATAEPRWAEAFFVLPFDDYISLIDRYFVDEKNCYYSEFYQNQESLRA